MSQKIVSPRKSERLNFAVGDLETDPFAPGRMSISPFCAGFFDGAMTSAWWGADCAEKFVAHCKALKVKTVVYFHNGGNFDFHFLLEFLPVADCKFLCIGKRIVQIKTPWNVEFRDSFAIIPRALAAYQKTEIDYRKFEVKRREKHRAEILGYLKDDLKDLHAMVTGFLKRFPPELTLASATFKILQKEYGAETGRSSEAYDSAMRPFYFAGRVQFWRLGKIPHACAVVDINSAFPWAMTKAHAHGTEFEVGAKMPKRNAEQSFFVVEADSNGELPVRKDDGGVDFPVGRNLFRVTGWELIAAMELNAVKNVLIHRVLTPKKTKDFGAFIRNFYDAKVAAKLRGDKDEEFFNKIVLNAGGYGKLAINPRKFSEVAVTTIFDTPLDVDGKTKRLRRVNAALAGWSVKWDDPTRGLTFHSRPSYREGVDKFVNVATAASITGCVRALLMRAKAACKNVVYCDTDSLVAESVSALKFSDGLGAWKLEMSFAPGKFYIAGKKLYAGFGTLPSGKKQWKTASKGVRLKPEQIVKVALGSEQTHVATAPTYSVFSPPRFVKRTIRRADLRK